MNSDGDEVHQVPLRGGLAVPAILQRELYALAHQAGVWTEGHTRSKLQTVFRMAYAAARGEKVQYAGVEVDPRYRFKNQTIIELLEITPDEEWEMTPARSTRVEPQTGA